MLVLFTLDLFEQQAMQNPAIQPVTTAKQTVDSRDKTAQRMCMLLGESEGEGRERREGGGQLLLILGVPLLLLLRYRALVDRTLSDLCQPP